MNSKQINFYIVPEDYEIINNFLRKKSCIVLSNNKIGQENYTLPKIDEEIFQIYLTTNEFKNEINIIENKNSRYFDIFGSCFIEFSLGGFYPYDKNILQRGRLYFVKNYCVNENIKNKNINFLKWSDLFLKEFKDNFLKKSKNDKYFHYSDNALKWIKDNNAVHIIEKNQWVLPTETTQIVP